MKKKIVISSILAILLLLAGCNKNTNENKSELNSSTTLQAESETQSNNTLNLQFESDHFKFYSKDTDKKCIEDLSNALEQNYARVTNDLNTKLDKTINVHIYSDLNAFHQGINQPNAPSWVVGSAGQEPNTINMVNPSNANGYLYSDFMKIIVHEFTHVVTSNINPDFKKIPLWLIEGIAVYEANQYSSTDIRCHKAKLGTNPLNGLETDSTTFESNNGYLTSYCILDYMVKTYGYDKVIASLKSPSDMETLLGISKQDFQNNIVAYINQNY